MVGIADGDREAVTDVDGRQPRSVNEHAVAALIDGHPTIARESQCQFRGWPVKGVKGGRAIQADIELVAVTHQCVAARSKDVAHRSEPHGQRETVRHQDASVRMPATFRHRSRPASRPTGLELSVYPLDGSIHPGCTASVRGCCGLAWRPHCPAGGAAPRPHPRAPGGPTARAGPAAVR